LPGFVLDMNDAIGYAEHKFQKDQENISRCAMIDDLDKMVIQLIQGDLPLVMRPFASLAKRLGISEEDFLGRIRALKKRGIIRRFGATLRHQEAGFSANAMVAWKVKEDKIETVGRAMAKFRGVTHCYQRQTQKDWEYNLYTMIHGEDEEECYRIAEKISKKVGIKEYVLLFSEREFKKTSMQYFKK